MNLYIVRHGECTHKKGVYIGSGTDLSINREGVLQLDDVAEKIGAELSGQTVVHSSSLKRSVESSKILSDTLHLQNITIDSSLNEINFGKWEGLTYNQIMEEWNKTATIWYNNPFDITPPGAEPFKDFVSRVKAYYNKIKKLECDNLIIVTHGGVIQILITLIKGDSIENRWNYNIKRGEFLKETI